MQNSAVYAVKVMPSSSAFVNSLSDSRYSTVTISPLLSAAVIVTSCVPLKNRPKVILLRNAFQLFSLILIPPVGFSMSFHFAVIVMFFAGMVVGISLSQPIKV